MVLKFEKRVPERTLRKIEKNVSTWSTGSKSNDKIKFETLCFGTPKILSDIQSQKCLSRTCTGIFVAEYQSIRKFGYRNSKVGIPPTEFRFPEFCFAEFLLPNFGM